MPASILDAPMAFSSFYLYFDDFVSISQYGSTGFFEVVGAAHRMLVVDPFSWDKSICL
jgi:hypothetical protein